MASKSLSNTNDDLVLVYHALRYIQSSFNIAALISADIFAVWTSPICVAGFVQPSGSLSCPNHCSTKDRGTSRELSEPSTPFAPNINNVNAASPWAISLWTASSGFLSSNALRILACTKLSSDSWPDVLISSSRRSSVKLTRLGANSSLGCSASGWAREQSCSMRLCRERSWRLIVHGRLHHLPHSSIPITDRNIARGYERLYTSRSAQISCHNLIFCPSRGLRF